MSLRIESLLWPLNIFWPGKKVAKNVPYGTSNSRKLDIYDRRPGVKGKPVIIFWYGGAWKHGVKEDYQFIGSYLSHHGVAVIPSYPLYPEQTYPGFIEDAEMVLEWVAKNIKRYGGDPNNIYIVGHSAGGHTAMTVAMNYEKQLSGCIGLGTPASMSVKLYDHIFNGQLKNGKAFLTNLINRKVKTRFLLLQGEMDQVVPPRDAQKIKTALEYYDNQVEVHYLRFYEHFGILQTVGSPLGKVLKTHKILKGFIK